MAEAVGRLALWDRRTPTGIAEGYDAADVDGQRQPPTRLELANSVAATIYAVWRGQVIKGAIDARLAPFGVPVPDGERSLTALRHLLETFDETRGVGASGIDFFAVDGVADATDRRDVTLLRAVQAALAKLSGPDFPPAFGGSTNQGDYRWGRLHRVTFDHPLGGAFNIPPASAPSRRPCRPARDLDRRWLQHRRRLHPRRPRRRRRRVRLRRRPGTATSASPGPPATSGPSPASPAAPAASPAPRSTSTCSVSG